jgi:hypothetical protein
MRDERIDIIQDFVDLYQHEETLAFFEFQCRRTGGDPVSGLCRISKPKGGTMRHLSLTFMVDTPDERTRDGVDEVLARIEGDTFRTALPPVAAVVAAPPISSDAENYVRQLDIMLQGPIDSGKPFIAEQLMPVLQEFHDGEASALVWWGEVEGPRSIRRATSTR